MAALQRFSLIAQILCILNVDQLMGGAVRSRDDINQSEAYNSMIDKRASETFKNNRVSSARALGGSSGQCEEGFETLRGHFSMGGTILRKVSDELSGPGCRQACASASDFICVAAQVQQPSTCFLLGYGLHSSSPHQPNVHYARVCNHGPACFKKIEGFTAEFSEQDTTSTRVRIPAKYSHSPVIQPLYCMVECELVRGAYCIGFDFSLEEGGPVCHIASLSVDVGPTFDLYLLSC